MTERSSQRRVKLVRLELEQRATDRCHARVALEWGAETYSGGADETGPELREPRCAANAATSALQQVVGADRATFELLDLATVTVFQTPAVVVALSIHDRDETLYSVGFCLVKQDLPQAAVKAVLNATNRFLQRLWSTD